MAEITSQSPCFFRIILPHNIQTENLELPRNFVKEHEESLSKYVNLKLRNGTKSIMKLRKSNGRAWLENGWRDFTEKYSIKCGYFLVFKYKGVSCFDVLIFDLSTSEIKYSKPSNKQAEKRKLVEVEEKGSEDGISDEVPHKARKQEGMENVDECSIVHNYATARLRMLQRVKAFHSPNPHFTVTMQPTYIYKSYLQIPIGPGKRYFHKGNKNVYLKLNEADERTWSMSCYIRALPRIKVTFTSGWKQFSQENHLQEGDICVFEMVNSTNMVFKVTIFRLSDEKVDQNEPFVSIGVASLQGKKDGDSKAFKCNEPSFAVRLGKAHVRKRSRLDIPTAHALRYLIDQHENVVFLHRDDGKTWSVNCKVYGHDSRAIFSRVRFSNGWTNFAVDNNLEEGDACVFKLVSQGPIHYKVTIFRDAEL